MDDKKRCQSCGMPLAEGYYGTQVDGDATHDEYCKFCYQNGSFTRPDLTLEDMIQLSVTNMTQDLKIPEELKGTVVSGVKIIYWIILSEKVMKQLKGGSE